MIPILRAEVKKLLSVRSTYVLLILALAMTVLINYFGTAQTIIYEEVPPAESSAQQPGGEPVDGGAQPPVAEPETGTAPTQPEVRTSFSRDLPKEHLVSNWQNTILSVSLFIAIAVVLLMAHEFRYNTISYTLTASNSRSKILAGKIVVCVAFAVLATLLMIAAATAVTYYAVAVKDLNLPPQDFNWVYVLSRLLAYSIGFSLMGLALITLVRSTAAGVTALLVLPTVDSIGGALLASRKIEATTVLPFSALNRVANVTQDLVSPGQGVDAYGSGNALVPATAPKALFIFILYLLAVWAITWYLFLRRDAR